MKKALLFFMVSIMLFCNVQAQTYLAYTATPPLIDGTIDDIWKIAPISTPNIIMDVELGSLGLEGDGKTRIENPAGQWRAMYDETKLYFLVEVEDLNPINNGPIVDGNVSYWAADGVEIFLSTAAGASQKQYGFGYKTGTPFLYGSSSEALIQKQIVAVAGGYVLEVSIPRSSLGLLATATQIKMELGINQSNTGNGRSAQILTWNNSRNHFGSSALYHLTDLACDEAVTLASDFSTVCTGNWK